VLTVYPSIGVYRDRFMILVSREVGSKELYPLIRRIGVPAEIVGLPFGDFAFEGNGPQGRINIGVERKALHDMLNCIDDARYSAHQKVGMAEMYDKSFLIVEGNWKPHDPEGFLMEGFSAGTSWGFCRYRSQRTMYSKLRRYLFSVSLSNVIVLYSRDQFQTAYDVCELFHYFQKSWANHTSLLEVQKLHIADLNAKPSLVRRWASDLTDIGVKHSIEAARLFKTPLALANSDETGWMRIKGVGIKTAQQIIKEIRGW
jgi:ERCC4-type nuclease